MRPLLLLLAACHAADRPADVAHTDVGDSDPPIGACTEGAALEFGRDLASGAMHDGDPVWYGIPPQGGAPYAPFEVRLRGPLSPGRPPAWATAVDVRTGEVIGSLMEDDSPSSVGVLCSNTGVHSGWWYGGEVHVRFWGLPLATLEGREIEVTIAVALPDGDTMEASATGTLRDEVP